MEKIQKYANYLVLVSACSHFFCCVLPTISSFIGLSASIGLFSTHFEFLEFFHKYEKEILIFSAAAITVSAISQFISWRINCRETGCQHEPCEEKKAKSNRVFNIAVILFAFNVTVFFLTGHSHHAH